MICVPPAFLTVNVFAPMLLNSTVMPGAAAFAAGIVMTQPTPVALTSITLVTKLDEADASVGQFSVTLAARVISLYVISLGYMLAPPN
jgi:hypothetical protein